MIRIRSRVAALVAVCLAVILALTLAQPASAATKSPDSISLTKWWTVVNKVDASPWVDTTRPVARCTNDGSTCTLTSATAVGTTIQVSLGYTKAGVAGQIGYSLTRTSTTSVACTSPKLAAGQAFMAYAEGNAMEYRIQEWSGGSYNGKPIPAKLEATSGWLIAFQPYPYPALVCRVVWA